MMINFVSVYENKTQELHIMLKKDTLLFLESLKENNTREWFTENKAWYERARANFEQFVAQIIQAIATFDPEIGNQEAKKCIFRIYKDTRFSKDKTPYKTNFGAIFRPRNGGKGSGYYLHIDPAECFVSCGQYMLPPDELKKIRRGIYNDFETLNQILNNKEFKKEFGGDLYRDENTLQRVPNGFDKNHPAAEYMKLKHFYVYKPITHEQLMSNDFVEYVAGIYKLMMPLNEYLNDLLTE